MPEMGFRNMNRGVLPMAPVDTVAKFKADATRLQALATIIRTYDQPCLRKNLIMRMYQADLITTHAAELLIETFGLEAA